MEMKQCSKCGESKPTTEFYKHSSTRDKLRPDCKVCTYQVVVKGWRQRNPERLRALNREQERRRKTLRREDWLEAHRRYRAEHPERLVRTNRAYRQRHPAKGTVDKARLRARLYEAPGDWSHEDFIALCRHYGNKCLCCGKSGQLTCDHVVPLSKSGTNYIENIQPLCPRCNSKKGSRIIDYRPADRPFVAKGEHPC